jgi:hypothetical protein
MTESPSCFASLDWTDQLDEMGIIAGGMADGAVTLWSASKIMRESGQPLKMGRGCISAA